jgi:hypothetical protein
MGEKHMQEMLAIVALEPTMALFTKHTRIFVVRPKGQQHFTLPTYERTPGDDLLQPVVKGLERDLHYKVMQAQLEDCLTLQEGDTKTTFYMGEVRSSFAVGYESNMEEIGYLMVAELMGTPNGRMYRKVFEYFGCEFDDETADTEETNA